MKDEFEPAEGLATRGDDTSSPAGTLASGPDGDDLPAESRTTDAVSHSTQRAAAFVRVLSLIG